MLTGQWGWPWRAVFGLALGAVVLVAGYFYGPDEGPDPEGNPSSDRGPSKLGVNPPSEGVFQQADLFLKVRVAGFPEARLDYLISPVLRAPRDG